MAAVFRSVGVSPGASSTSCVIVKPAGLTVGDLMIAQVISSFTSGTPSAISAPGSWTQIRQDAGDKVRTALFWKIAVQADIDATDFTFTTVFNDANDANIGAITAWTGHNTSTPINANNGQWNDSSTATSPAITPSVADCVVLLFVGIEIDIATSGYAIATDNPASWTEAYDIGFREGTDCALAMGYADRPETSSTGLGTATIPLTRINTGQLVAIAPSVLVDVTITVPLATVDSAGLTPILAIEPEISVPLAIIDATGLVPVITTTKNPTIVIPLATVSGEGLIPTIRLDVIFSVPLATVESEGLTPSLVLDRIFSIPLGTIDAEGLVLTIAIFVPISLTLKQRSLNLTLQPRTLSLTLIPRSLNLTLKAR